MTTEELLDSYKDLTVEEAEFIFDTMYERTREDS